MASFSSLARARSASRSGDGTRASRIFFLISALAKFFSLIFSGSKPPFFPSGGALLAALSFSRSAFRASASARSLSRVLARGSASASGSSVAAAASAVPRAGPGAFHALGFLALGLPASASASSLALLAAALASFASRRTSIFFLRSSRSASRSGFSGASFCSAGASGVALSLRFAAAAAFISSRRLSRRSLAAAVSSGDRFGLGKGLLGAPATAPAARASSRRRIASNALRSGWRGCKGSRGAPGGVFVFL